MFTPEITVRLMFCYKNTLHDRVSILTLIILSIRYGFFILTDFHLFVSVEVLNNSNISHKQIVKR